MNANSVLWYASPAANWSEGIPLGNGKMGAMVLSRPYSEQWTITELTYWSGRAEQLPAEGAGKDALTSVRTLLFSEDYAGAHREAKRHFQPVKGNFGTNLSVCDVMIDFERPPQANVETDESLSGLSRAKRSSGAPSFRRELDLRTALASAKVACGEHKLEREMFTSHADDLLAARFQGDGAGRGLSLTLHVSGRTDRFEVTQAGNHALEFRGQATETVHSDGTCGVCCQGYIELQATGGTVRAENGKLIVDGADEVIIYMALATDYRAQSPDWHEHARQLVKQRSAQGYDAVRQNHLNDYVPLFNRVSFALHSPADAAEAALQPTDRRLSRLRQGESDPALFALYFQYGRYLMIAASRADSPLPMHLQGIWNDGEACRMGWSCDYHLDVNTQMNYYPAEAIHLGESHLPLMRYVADLAEAGKSTASTYYGSPGWVAHVFSNVWGFTVPGWDISWGMNVTGGLWLASHMIRHYRYSCDLNFLEKQAYPVLREASSFFIDYMTLHPKYGWLVTGPSNSPENHFYAGSQKNHVWQLSMGSTMDQTLVRELFEFCLEAACMLGCDPQLQQQLQEAIAQLPPLQIGKQGQLQEWLQDFEEAQPEHRHMSHLYALYPACQITPERTPELAAAAGVTLEKRSGQEELEDIEFTAALFSLFYARLWQGNKALHHAAHLISELSFDNLLSYSKAGIAGAESNIFVVDGNFGGTAAIAEMLVQGYDGEIHLLPALPDDWPAGRITGLRTEGNVEVDIAWEEGRVTEVRIQRFSPGKLTLRSGSSHLVLDDAAGTELFLDGNLHILSSSEE